VNADATINVRVGGHGPASWLIHGFGDTGDMWSPMAAELAKDHTVVVPTCAAWACPPHTRRRLRQVDAGRRHPRRPRQARHRPRRHRGHDIGTMVAYAYAARYPDKTSRLS